MTRSAAAKATAAADALLDWLRTQSPQAFQQPSPLEPSPAPPQAGGPETPTVAHSAGHLEEDPGMGLLAAADPLPVTLEPTDRQDPENVARVATQPSQGQMGRGAPLRLAHPDWLYHQLTISGPDDDVAEFRDAAAGSGTIPWHLDLDRTEEDFFLLLVSPPPLPGSLTPQQRTLSLAGARIVAGQLRGAVARRHALAVARVCRSRACPFDLHALVPVPDDVLRLGPDDPTSLAWLWEHWGTTQPLRHVAESADADERRRPQPGEAVLHLIFWSADWTPWRALVQIAARWPALRFDTRPTYGAA